MSDDKIPKPVTLRTIAESVGVSAMTVSLALRNHPRIPEATRERVQRAAVALGYRPDPQVTKLMHHLRVGRQPVFQASIAAITTVPAASDTVYMSGIIRSAQARAEQMGYGFNVYRIEHSSKRQPSLNRMLRSRGVEGIVLLPIVSPGDMTALLDWKTFAVVTTTFGILTPHFHRVVPHQFGNALEICHQLMSLGYRRIGLVLPVEHEVRVHHGFSAAVVWQSVIGGTEFVRPCIHTGALPSARELAGWFKKEHPDAIIAAGDKSCQAIAESLGLSPGGRIGFVSASKDERSLFAGMYERPEELGSTAIEQLAAMIQRGEKGLPAVPKITMVDGHWMEGPSLSNQSRKPRKAKRAQAPQRKAK